MDYNLAKRLKHRVTLRREQNTPDGMGGIIEGWTDVATLWAGVEPRRARELVEAEGITNEVTHVVIIRHRSDVGPDDSIRYQSRDFKILSIVNPEESNRYLELVCQEQV